MANQAIFLWIGAAAQRRTNAAREKASRLTRSPASAFELLRIRGAPVTGDPNKIVCKKEETLGTRLGATKVCLTVQQWTDRAKEHKEFTEKIQSSPRMHRE